VRNVADSNTFTWTPYGQRNEGGVLRDVLIHGTDVSHNEPYSDTSIMSPQSPLDSAVRPPRFAEDLGWREQVYLPRAIASKWLLL